MKLVIFMLCVAVATGDYQHFSKGRAKGSPRRDHSIVQVHLEQGSIFAERQPADDAGSRYFYAFQGIPYAQPPVGNLRFRDPVPAGSWSQPRNGSFIPAECPQLATEFFLEGQLKVEGDEDCLYLNVFTPKPHISGNLPVMVWIHGGSFSYGNASFYKPLPLLTRDVVLVTIQFRHGTLGFLSTEDSVIPGNFGLKDQTMALAWVRENIRHFGGNPNSVTIFGESSGGASVHYQMLTPHAKGLFHRAILQSGSALCSWALVGGHRDVALQIGQRLNCPVSQKSSSPDSQQLLACLQRASFIDLTLAEQINAVWHFTPSVMKPRVDGDYIPEHPATLIKEGRYSKVDLISGNNQDEGADYALGILFNPAAVSGIKENFGVTGPLALRLRGSDLNPEYLARRAFYRYLNEVEIRLETVTQFGELLADRLYNVCQDETSLFHGQDSRETGHEVYRYKLRHRGQQSYVDVFGNPLGKKWVTHADDLQYFFEDAVRPFQPLERADDLFVRDIMLTLWINFAATGNPTPDQSLGFRWAPVSQCGTLQHLAIQTVPSMEEDRKEEVREFWKNLPTEQNMILYPELFYDDQESGVLRQCSHSSK